MDERHQWKIEFQVELYNQHVQAGLFHDYLAHQAPGLPAQVRTGSV